MRRFGMRWVMVASAAAAFALVLPASAAAVNATYTFDSGAQGWYSVSTDICNSPAPSNWDPGGFLTGADNLPGEECFWLAGPPLGEVGGNLKANYGGTISVDVRHEGPADYSNRIYIVGVNGGTVSAPGPDATGGWDTITLPVNEHVWSDDGGLPMDKGYLFEVLANVQTVQVLGDMSDGQGQITQIDNFQITEAAPARDEDADGLANAEDDCPVVAATGANGCPPQSGEVDEAACKKAKKKLAKAKAKLKKLKQKDAEAKAIAKAKQKIKKAKKAKKKACAPQPQRASR